ncbi:MAG TPA: aspartate-semialdehyde dehydrogenase, partial [Novosphingobium sp.]|nr:aspartate-semialdehyde dehydrogenase [Novosphingobium sp.]
MVSKFAPGQKLNVGIVGATGVVGSAMLAILKERSFPMATLRLFASARSAGRQIDGVTIEDA